MVVFINDVDGHDVFNMGRTIRYHGEYQPAGTNANFARVLNRHRIKLRTYERGVEDETLACGTGAVATALVASWTGLVDSPVDVLVKSEETLKIYFEKRTRGSNRSTWKEALRWFTRASSGTRHITRGVRR